MPESYDSEQLLKDKAAYQKLYDNNTQRKAEIDAQQVYILNQIAIIDTIIGAAVTPAPTGFMATLVDDYIKLDWDDVADGIFTLERSQYANFISTEVVYTGGAATFNDPAAGLSEGTTYYYRLNVVVPDKSLSAWVTTTIAYLSALDAVINLVPSAASTPAPLVTLNWDDVANATSYKVLRNTVNTLGTADEVATPAIPKYSDTDVIDGNTYYYWIVAAAPFYIDSTPTASGAIVVEDPS